MILHELNAAHRATILATDIDRVVLTRAKEGGPYAANEMRNVSAKQMESYFTKAGDTYRIVDTMRRRIDFRELNLLSDRFDRNFDLIVCRNVMIYFSDETKQMLFEKFHQSLTPNGVLFVGGTEALLGADSRGFERLGGNFYGKAADTGAVQRSRLSA
jgi:chemotaxis protein methyltransferase CheR